MKKTDDQFFKYMDFVLPLIQNADLKLEFLQDFFRNKLGIDDLNSTLSIENTRVKTILYFLVLLIDAYDEKSKEHYDQKTRIDLDGNPLYFVKIGNIEPYELCSYKDDFEIIKPNDPDDLKIFTDDTVLIFNYAETPSILDYLKRIIDNMEMKNSEEP